MEVGRGRRGASSHGKLVPIPFSSIKMREGFWSPRQHANRAFGLRHGYEQLHKAGNLLDLRLAAGIESGRYVGKVFMDSDVYKWLEAIAYELFKEDDSDLRRMSDEVIALVEKAQRPDGYINSYFQIAAPERQWKDLSHGHELYCAGHLIEAAIAFKRLLGDLRLFDVAVRFVEHIDNRFGSGKIEGTPGHPEIELALVELYRETGNERYLRLAKYFVDQRGKGLLDPGPNTGHNGPSDLQDHVPVRDAFSVEGHAVRQLYLNAGVTDLYLETGEQALLDSMRRQWTNMADSKMYVTGGLGSRHNHEAFSESFELPNSRAYCETCAAIANIMWSWRMLLATGERAFADVIEHTLYNAFLSGVSLDSTLYFYCNPLLSLGRNPYASRKRIERMAWPWTPCCPPNVMRTFAMLAHFVATTDDRGLQIHQYINSRIEFDVDAAGKNAVSIESGFPWRGDSLLTIETDSPAEWTLMARIPRWATSWAVLVNGQPSEAARSEGGYVVIRKRWAKGDTIRIEFPIEPYLVEANPIVDSAFDSFAVKRGPVVYCLEQFDQDASVNVLTARIDESARLHDSWRGDVLGGVVTVEAEGEAPSDSEWAGELYRPYMPHSSTTGSPVKLQAIPYYAWANRGENAMRVWIPRRRTR